MQHKVIGLMPCSVHVLLNKILMLYKHVCLGFSVDHPAQHDHCTLSVSHSHKCGNVCVNEDL